MILFSAEAILASSTSKSRHSNSSVGNCEQVHTSILNLIFQQANVAGVGNCQNEDLKSAVVVGLLHNYLKNFPH